MKTMLFSAMILAVSLAAAQAAPAAKGQKLVSCSATDGDVVEVTIYHNPDGSFRASVMEESFGGSYPTFHYDVHEVRSSDGEEVYEGEKFSLKIGRDRQAMLVIAGNSNEMDCR
jgi:hypothetical protein